ncbi:hypothetical protein JCM11251_006637 [Rhodosporidiobolus azoricus]
MEKRAILTLTFSVVTALSAGTNYAFSAYAPQLSAALHLSSLATNTVGAAGNAGVYLSGPLVGVIVDKRGPRVVLLAAAGCLFVGYLGMWTMYRGGEEGLYATLGLGGLAFCQILTGIGGSAALAAAVKATSQSFSKARRGAAMATVLSGFGLSAFFYSTLSHWNLFSSADPTAGFLLTLSLGCGLSILLGALFIRPPPPGLHQSSAGPDIASSSRNQYLAVSTSDEEGGPFSSRPSSPLYGPHERPASEYSLHSDFQAYSPRRSLDQIPERPSSRRRQRSTSPLLAMKDREGEVHGAGDLDVNGWELLRTSDFWWLFSFLGLCSGVGLMYINNLGTMTTTLASLDPSADPLVTSRSQAHLVSLLSIFNCIGRLFVGFCSDFSTHHSPAKLRFARIWWLVVTATLFVLSQLLAAQAERVEGLGGLALPTALTGFAYGCLFGSVPVVCLERFGIANYATNNGFLTISPSIFANFSNALFGLVYDSHVVHAPSTVDSSSPSAVATTALRLARRAPSPAPAHLCTLGRECFATAFHATTLMSLAAVGIAVALSMRRSFKPVYHT